MVVEEEDSEADGPGEGCLAARGTVDAGMTKGDGSSLLPRCFLDF